MLLRVKTFKNGALLISMDGKTQQSDFDCIGENAQTKTH